MNIIFISPNYPAGHWRYIAALHEAGHTILGIGDAGDETFPPILRGCLTEYYRVGDLHDYDSVYRACAHFVSRCGRIDAIESLNPYWCDLVEALKNEGFFNHTSPAVHYASAVDALAQKGDILSPRAMYTSINGGRKFAKEYGYPILAVPRDNKSIGRRMIGSDKELRELWKEFSGEKFLVAALPEGDIISIDGLYIPAEDADSHEPKPVLAACTAHIVSGDGCVVYSPLSQEEISAIDRAAYSGECGFFHIDARRADKAIPNIAKRGELILCDITYAPPHQYIIDCMNVELGADLRALWAKSFGDNTPAQPVALQEADDDTDTAATGEDMASADNTTEGEEIKYPLVSKRLAAAVSRSFDRSYKNPHEKVVVRLGLSLDFHSRTEEFDRGGWNDYIYIFSADTPQKLRGNIKFITEDFTQCK